MAVNGSLLGRETIAFMAKGSDWGEENSVGKGVYLLEDGISYSQEMIAVEESDSVWSSDMDINTVSSGLDYRQYLRFDDIRGIAYVLGGNVYQDPTEVNTGKGDYRHLISPSPDNFADFATFALKKGGMVQVFPSVKYAGFTITGQTNPGRMELKCHAFANNLKTDSPAITGSNFENLVYPAGNGGFAYFRNLKVYIKDRDAGAITEADLVSGSLTNLEFSFQRQLVSDYTNTSGFEIEEPVEDAVAETSLSLSFRNYDSQVESLFNSWKLNGRKKLRIEVTGAAASSATGDVHPASLIIDIPNAALDSVDPGAYSGAGRISGTVNLKALGVPAGVTVTDMPWKEPFRMEIVNNQQTKAIL